MKALLVAIATLAACGAASAAVAISASPTSVTASAVTINGNDQSSTFSVTFSVSGVTQALGYSATAYAPVPAGGGNTLAALSVASAPALSCTQGQCTTGTNNVTYPVTLGTTSGTATKIFNATAGSANKNQQAVVTFSIPVNADEFPGTYTTTLTVNVADGP